MAQHHRSFAGCPEKNMTDRAKNVGWSEETSRHFIDYGAYFVPEREVQIETLCSVVPPVPPGGTIVEICCGEGLLAAALAERYPDAEFHALDGSETMLAATREKLAAAGVAHETRLIDIAAREWRRFEQPVHAFVSSLAVHHLDGPGKALLFRDLAAALAPGGVVVICDLVEARREAGRALWARHWDEGVRRRALDLDGTAEMHEFFRADGWNYYEDPDADPVDQPSSLFDQLRWLEEAGLVEADVHWLKAGHAIFSACKP